MNGKCQATVLPRLRNASTPTEESTVVRVDFLAAQSGVPVVGVECSCGVSVKISIVNLTAFVAPSFFLFFFCMYFIAVLFAVVVFVVVFVCLLLLFISFPSHFLSLKAPSAMLVYRAGCIVCYRWSCNCP
ncbi:hypothetical protein TcG_03818 [Trypanosoma cruzi]|nr:hypothetical protein TcG_03818 [Trypanosoma cruzi]